MKKFIKKFIISIVISLIMCHNLVIAASNGEPSVTWNFAPNSFFTEGLGNGISNIGQKISELVTNNDSTIGKIMGLLSVILIFARLVCLAAVLIMGIRYMMSNAENRADLKQRLFPLFIGSVVIFGASSIMSIAINYINEVF